jgi:hypothetical protein
MQMDRTNEAGELVPVTGNQCPENGAGVGLYKAAALIYPSRLSLIKQTLHVLSK